MPPTSTWSHSLAGAGSTCHIDPPANVFLIGRGNFWNGILNFRVSNPSRAWPNIYWDSGLPLLPNNGSITTIESFNGALISSNTKGASPGTWCVSVVFFVVLLREDTPSTNWLSFLLRVAFTLRLLTGTEVLIVSEEAPLNSITSGILWIPTSPWNFFGCISYQVEPSSGEIVHLISANSDNWLGFWLLSNRTFLISSLLTNLVETNSPSVLYLNALISISLIPIAYRNLSPTGVSIIYGSDCLNIQWTYLTLRGVNVYNPCPANLDVLGAKINMFSSSSSLKPAIGISSLIDV